jgi:glycosyltransferase involved in cell wall biosynthesis
VNTKEKVSPLISVIIPVYNVEKYVAHCIDSVITQTYQNLEIILVDDGSKDSSAAICDEYERKDGRIVVIHKENGGLSSARNAGLDIAKGEWIAFVDSDDWVSPETYEEMMRALTETDAEIATCGRVNEWTNRKWYKNDSGEIMVLDGRDNMMRSHNVDFGNEVWDKLYPKSFFDSGIRFVVGKKFEDIDLLFAVYQKLNKMVCVKKPFYHYRQRKGSIIHTPEPKGLMDLWRSRKAGFDYFEKEMPKDVRKKFLYILCIDAHELWNNGAEAPKELKKSFLDAFEEIAEVFREHYAEIKAAHYSPSVRFVFFMLRYNTVTSYAILYACTKLNNWRKRDDRNNGKKWIMYD